MAFIARQPNGLLCRFSSVLDFPTNYNMTDEDYIEMCAEAAREEARELIKNGLRPFSDVIDNFLPNNMTTKDFNDILKKMGV